MREEKNKQMNNVKKDRPSSHYNSRFVINEFEELNGVDVKKSYDAFGNPIIHHEVLRSLNLSSNGARSSFLALPRDKQINHVVSANYY